MASYPSTVKTFTTKASGYTIQGAHVNDAQDELTALETALLTSGLAHTLKFVDNTYDIGATATFRPRDLFLSRNAVVGRTLTVNGFGTHAFSAGGAGSNILQVANTTDGTANSAYLRITAGTTEGYLQAYAQSYTTSGIAIASSVRLVSAGTGGLVLVASDAAGVISFYAGGTTRRMLIAKTGVVTMDYYGAGTATFSASGVLSAVSDERLKDGIAPLGYGLAEVLALDPIQYTWTDASGLNDPARTVYGGFGAANVKAAMPLAVGVDPRGFLTLSDRPILGAAVNAIKTINQRLAALEARA